MSEPVSNDNDNSFTSSVTFKSMGLNRKILKSLRKMKWESPTDIQASTIPLALSGKDLLVQATTGSGKTAIFLLPIIHKLLEFKESQASSESASKSVFALVLSPTKELSKQTEECCLELTKFAPSLISVQSWTVSQGSNVDFSALDVQRPDILIATPFQIAKCLTSYSSKLLRKVKFLAIDEADAMFSDQFENNIRTILTHMPKHFQSIVLSATMTRELAIIKTLLPHNLALVRLMNQELPAKKQLKQLFIKVEQRAKFTVLLYLLKFKKIGGKCLIFCNSMNCSYKLKLFLDSFKVQCCVLNDQLPFNSRKHAVSAFNDGKFDIIIATDLAAKSFRTDKAKNSDYEFSLSRGIDFQDVAIVVNFDFPQDSSVYIHRAGRTARGVKKGTVLSFLSKSDQSALESVQERLKSDEDEEQAIQELSLDMVEIDKLGYRVTDVLSSITKKTVRDAKMQEINSELLNSEKLKKHFKKNPADLKAIEHVNNESTKLLKRKFTDISDIPGYLVDPSSTSSGDGIKGGMINEIEQPKKDDCAVDRKKAKKTLQKETLDYYKQLGLLKKGKKSRQDPLKNL